ncbi:hypothetical protein [Lysinibacter cavernae]|uniref:Very-short-patch-repair endonuclease n=1 Tax=Lysinibacter cavernae TaxID=1640652 RepID=A0A7X5TS85_9MICO|nr:hypothetical protein [Lysinibacter cavernae]NIH53211.1 very-short-patch-repair endonuclease [Lysinibacter cavernae]
MIREGSDSRQETLLRLLLADAGLPEPELNVDVCDSAGNWIARVDLLYSEFGVVVEYDGDQHRTSKRQYERDIHRFEDLMLAMNAVVRVRASGLASGWPDTLHRVTSALRSAGWSPG